MVEKVGRQAHPLRHLPFPDSPAEAAEVQGIKGYFVLPLVIPPFLAGCIRRVYAAIFSFWAGVMPPMPMFGRSLL